MQAEMYTIQKSIKAQTATKDAVVAYVTEELGFSRDLVKCMFAGSYWIICIPSDAMAQTHNKFFGKLYLERFK